MELLVLQESQVLQVHQESQVLQALQEFPVHNVYYIMIVGTVQLLQVE